MAGAATRESGFRARMLAGLLRLLARLFFRRVEVVGQEHVPEAGGGLLVAWHPNGLADGILILGFCPRPVVFGARHGLFRLPLVGWVLRGVGAVPLYRPQDRGQPGAPTSDGERRAANQESLGALAAAARRSFVAVFPEGATHDEPGLLELRTGAARLFARARENGAAPALLPVGLHYERKHAFRSRALVTFHPPVELAAELVGEADGLSGSGESSFVARLTAEIERRLVAVTHPTESWEIHRAMQRVTSLVRAERAARAGTRLERAAMHERDLGFSRVWLGYHAWRATDPAALKGLLTRVTRYGEALRLLGLDDRDLDRVPVRRTVLRFLLLLTELVLMLALLPTVVLVGNLINLPAALLVRHAARRLSVTRKEEAGLKIVLGFVVLPTAWLLSSLLVSLIWTRPLPGFDWYPESLGVRFAGMLALCCASALLGLRYHRFVGELGHGLRALWAGGFRRRTLARLRRRRAELYEQVIRMAPDVDLPGAGASERMPAPGSSGASSASW